MNCYRCKKEIKESYTSKDNKTICKECLEKEIYKERKRVIKNEQRHRKDTRKTNEQFRKIR